MSGFSERLSALRRGAGMTQAELAKKLGISKSSVSMYECGNREPEFDLLEKMENDVRLRDLTHLWEHFRKFAAQKQQGGKFSHIFVKFYKPR